MKVSPSALGSTRNAFEKFKMFSMVCFEGPATFFLPPFFGEFEEAEYLKGPRSDRSGRGIKFPADAHSGTQKKPRY